jgi:hypothetical protein
MPSRQATPFTIHKERLTARHDAEAGNPPGMYLSVPAAERMHETDLL